MTARLKCVDSIIRTLIFISLGPQYISPSFLLCLLSQFLQSPVRLCVEHLSFSAALPLVLFFSFFFSHDQSPRFLILHRLHSIPLACSGLSSDLHPNFHSVGPNQERFGDQKYIPFCPKPAPLVSSLSFLVFPSERGMEFCVFRPVCKKTFT